MPIRFQADADLNQIIVSAVLRREPAIDFRTATAARLAGLKDAEVLALAACEGRTVEHLKAGGVMRYAVLVALITAGTGVQASAQDTSAKDSPRFEVASVKPCEPRDAATPEEFMRLLSVAPLSGNRYYQPCTTIWQLALFAYDLPRSRLRYPPWASLEFYEIDARAGSPAGIEDMRLMVRHLLADRFALRSHTEVVALDVLMLVLAQPGGRLGPNAKPAAIDCSPTVLEAPDDKRRVHCDGTAGGKDGVMTRIYNGITMSRFAQSLSGRDVIVDGTGLDGSFDLTLSYDIRTFDVDVPVGRSNDGARDRALEKQLGLKLVRGKGSVEILVVDSVQRPTPN